MESVPSPIWLAEDNSEAWRSGVISAAAPILLRGDRFRASLAALRDRSRSDREVAFTLVLCAVHPEKPFDFAGKAYWLQCDVTLKAFVDQWLRQVIPAEQACFPGKLTVPWVLIRLPKLTAILNLNQSR